MRNAECGMRNGTDRLRALNVPQRAQVELDACGLPSRIGVVPIEAVRETWRIDDEWWREPITRTYYEVLLYGGGRLGVFIGFVAPGGVVEKTLEKRGVGKGLEDFPFFSPFVLPPPPFFYF